MISAIELASDVVTGGTALGGLLLVYVGGVTASYASFEKTQQSAVRARHQSKAWLSVIGLIFALLAAALAVLGKWFGNECIASVSVVLLLLALLWGCGAAILSAREIH